MLLPVCTCSVCTFDVYFSYMAGIFFRQLALFHNFEWLLETVEHILVTDGQLQLDRENETVKDAEREEEDANDENRIDP